VLGERSQELRYGIGSASYEDIDLDKPLTHWGLTFPQWNQRLGLDLQVPSIVDLGIPGEKKHPRGA
jgi:hypothetical protein